MITDDHTGLTPPARGEPEWVELRPSTGWFRGLAPRELWSYREVARTLVLRDFKSRYKQAALGVAWAILQPLASVVLFTLVFGRLAGLPSEGLPYVVFVFAGLLGWNYFANGVTAASRSLVEEPDLVTKIYFPRILAPAAALVPPLIDLGIALVAMAVVMAVTGVAPGPQIVTLPVWFGLIVVLALGVGLLYAALQVRFHDVGHATGLVLQLWFFATPVIYSATTVHGFARVALSLNPMTGLVDGLRWSLADGRAPAAIDLLGCVSFIIMILVGLSYFQRTERHFADFI